MLQKLLDYNIESKHSTFLIPKVVEIFVSREADVF